MLFQQFTLSYALTPLKSEFRDDKNSNEGLIHQNTDKRIIRHTWPSVHRHGELRACERFNESKRQNSIKIFIFYFTKIKSKYVWNAVR